MGLLIKDFLSKRSFVLVASTQPGGLFFKEKASVPAGQQYTTQNLEYGTQTTGQGAQDDMTPDGCAFTVTGWREQNGTLFLKMVDKWDILANKGKYGP